MPDRFTQLSVCFTWSSEDDVRRSALERQVELPPAGDFHSKTLFNQRPNNVRMMIAFERIVNAASGQHRPESRNELDRPFPEDFLLNDVEGRAVMLADVEEFFSTGEEGRDELPEILFIENRHFLLF